MKCYKLHFALDESINRSSVYCLFQYPMFALILIFMLSFVIRALRLDFNSLWYDEATTAYLLQHKSVGEVFKAVLNTSGSETLHPLYYVILSGWTCFAGCSEWVLRFPSVIFGAGSVVVFILIFYEICGRTAFALGSLLVISPFLMWYARDARPYAQIMLISGLHLLLYLKILRNSQSKTLLAGFILTGAMMIYSGILTGMLLVSEIVWVLFVKQKNRIRNVLAVMAILVLSLPLVWHGWRTHFAESSGRYQKLPSGVTVARVMAIPQEFFVGRSFGPTPDEIRRFSLNEVIRKKVDEISVEAMIIIFIFVSFLVSFKSTNGFRIHPELNVSSVYAIGFVVLACIFQVVALVLVTHYSINARHLAFLFGPLFILGTLPATISRKRWLKLTFALPVLLLWTWSCSNQLFNGSYSTEDYRGAANIIKNDKNVAAGIIALCHPDALRYYGVERALNYIHESPDITLKTIKEYVVNDAGPAWLVLARPWNYPQLCYKELVVDFQVLREEHLPGIDMWLLTLPVNQ